MIKIFQSINYDGENIRLVAMKELIAFVHCECLMTVVYGVPPGP